MGFFDRLGDTWDVLQDVGKGVENSVVNPKSSSADVQNWLTSTAIPHVGAAWTAAHQPVLGQAIFNALSPGDGLINAPADSPVGKIRTYGTEALQLPIEYGVKRPLSTALQVGMASDADNDSWGDLMSWKQWRKAWDDSEDVSLGQAAVSYSMEQTGQDKPDWLNSSDPFGKSVAGARNNYFHDQGKGGSWQAKFASGAIDATVDLTADPLIVGGKAAKAAQVANRLVDVADESKVLEAAKGGAAAPEVTAAPKAGLIQSTFSNPAKQAAGVTRFADQAMRMPNAFLPAMPQLRASADAGAMASIIRSIKSDQTLSEAQKRDSIIDVLGTSWGNKASQDSLIKSNPRIALELQAATNAPEESRAAATASATDNAQNITDAQARGDIDLFANKAAVDAQADNANQLPLTHTFFNTADRIAVPDQRERAAFYKNSYGVGQDTVINGPFSTISRIVGHQVSLRNPDTINVKDADEGYTQFSQVLSNSRHLSGLEKQRFLRLFTEATNADGRQRVVQVFNDKTVSKLGLKYGFSPQQIQDISAAGHQSTQDIKSAISSKVYTGEESQLAGDKISFYDPETGQATVATRARWKSQIENEHYVINPYNTEKTFRKIAQGNLMKLGDKGLVSSPAQTAISIGDDILRQTTSLWKDAQLLRGAYPLRILTDSFLRLGIHMNTLAFVATRINGFRGLGHYLMTDADDGLSTDKLRSLLVDPKNYKNVVKRGDFGGAVHKVLGARTGLGSDFDLSPEDSLKIFRESLGGGATISEGMMAVNDYQLRRLRSGDWTVMEPPRTVQSRAQLQPYLEFVQRVLNHHLANSPTALHLIDADVPEVAAEVRRQLKVGRGPLQAEYKEVGHGFDSIEEWLTHSKKDIDHYLPTEAMRNVLRDYRTKKTNVYKIMHAPPAEDLGNPRSVRVPTPGPAGTSGPALLPGVITPDVPTARNASRVFVGGKTGLRAYSTDELSRAMAEGDKGRAFAQGAQYSSEETRLGRGSRHREGGLRGRRIAGNQWSSQPTDVPVLDTVRRPGTPLDVTGSDVSTENAPLSDDQTARPASAHGDRTPIEQSPELKATKPTREAQYVDHAESQGLFSTDMLYKMLFPKNGKQLAMRVHGEMYSVREQSALRGWYNTKRETWYQFAADMPETVLARAPLFWDSYRQRVARQLEGIDKDALSSQDIQQVRMNAIKQARQDIGKILYNASDVSNLASTLRYVSPFFTAWEDTMRKYSGLFYDQPAYLPRLNDVTQSANNAGLVRDANGNLVDAHHHTYDKNGNVITDPNYDGQGQYVYLPKSMTKHIPLINKIQSGGQITIRKDSINSVFQGEPWWLPGFGPMVGIPANKLVLNGFPTEANDPIMKYVLPFGTTTDSTVTQLLPKWVKTARDSGVFGKTAAYQNQWKVFAAQATIDNDHQPLSGKQLKAIDNKTRNFFILKAVVDFNSPVSITPNAKYQVYIDAANQMRTQNDPDWENKFFQEYPGFGEMAISLSADNTGIQATTEAFNASQTAGIKAAIRTNPSYGWLFVGPANTGTFNGGVYDWQKTHEAGYGLDYRGSKSPQQALDDIQAARGWTQWNQVNTAINLYMQQNGIPNLQSKAGAQLKIIHDAVKLTLEDSNPAWAKEVGAAEGGGAGLMIDAATSFVKANPSMASRSDFQALSSYVAARDAVKLILATRETSNLQDTRNLDLANALQAYGQSLTSNPGFETMWNKALQFDTLSDIKVKDGQVQEALK